MVSDWRNHESWHEAGRPEAAHQANRLVKAFLAEYESPPMDDAIRAELDDFVGRRKSEGGVDTDF